MKKLYFGMFLAFMNYFSFEKSTQAVGFEAERLPNGDLRMVGATNFNSCDKIHKSVSSSLFRSHAVLPTDEMLRINNCLWVKKTGCICRFTEQKRKNPNA